MQALSKPVWISCDGILVERIQVKASPTNCLSCSVLFAEDIL